MHLTEHMLAAAMCKAIEAGLFPRHVTPREHAINQQIMRLILEAALEKADVVSGQNASLHPFNFHVATLAGRAHKPA